MQTLEILAALIALAMALGFLAEIVRHGSLVWLAKTMTDDQVATFVALRDAKAGRSKPSACPCRDLHSLTLTPGATFELPPGTKAVDLTTRFGTAGVDEVQAAFGDVARTLRKGH